jgi:hypothetical protein
MKKFLIIFLSLVVIVVIAGLLAPKNYSLQREIHISRSSMEVFDIVRCLELQNEWSVWGKIDPEMKTSMSGIDGTVGFIWSWEGNKEAGKGEQEITGIDEGHRIDYVLRFYEPFKSTSTARITTDSVDHNQTLVRWGMQGKMGFPMNLMMLFMNLEKAIGEDFQQGLSNLKQMMEFQNFQESEQVK